MDITHLIFENLIHNEEYARKVMSFLKPEYFSDKLELTVFKLQKNYFDKYNRSPTIDTMLIDLDNIDTVNDVEYEKVKQLITTLKQPVNQSQEWLLNHTETFCKERAIHLALMESIKIVEGESAHENGAIPQILTKALGVSFNTKVGHDYVEDAEKRHAHFNNPQNKVPFDIEMFNKVTNGGLPGKTFTVFMAPPHCGKSLLMNHFTGANLQDNKNALYFTLELAEEDVSKRIDAGLMATNFSEVMKMNKEEYLRNIEKVARTVKGKIKVIEYPSRAHCGHFRHSLNELKHKSNFIPDIIYIDYLNITGSYIMKAGGNTNDYFKSVSEEIRNLSKEYDVPIVSAVQTNRGGVNQDDPDVDDIAEAFAIVGTVDALFAIISNDELKAKNQMLIKQLKNRLGDYDTNKKFLIGVDRPKFKLYDVVQFDNVASIEHEDKIEEFKRNASVKFDRSKLANLN